MANPCFLQRMRVHLTKRKARRIRLAQDSKLLQCDGCFFLRKCKPSAKVDGSYRQAALLRFLRVEPILEVKHACSMMQLAAEPEDVGVRPGNLNAHLYIHLSLRRRLVGRVACILWRFFHS